MSRAVLGEWNAICDRCGFEFKASRLREEWTGWRVCDPCWEPRHPQETPKVPTEDPGVPWSRPPDATPPYIKSYGIGVWAIGSTFIIPPHRDVTSLTYSDNGDGTYTVLATCPNHRFTNGDTVGIIGASDSAYNGDQTISLLDGDKFTYTISSEPSSNEDPASGVEADGIREDTNQTTFNRWLTTEWAEAVFS